MEKLMEDNAGRAAKVCLLGLIGDHYNHAKNCQKLLARLAKQDSRVVMDAIGSKIFDEKLLFKFQVNVFNDIFSATNSNAVAYFLDKYGLEGARLIARHLPSPYLKDGKEPLVPPVTETVLTRFGDDEKTLRNFLAGRHGYQVYSGDISAQKLIEAEAAKPFLGHHISAVRRWAKFEVTSGKSDAEYWKIHNEEMDLE